MGGDTHNTEAMPFHSLLVGPPLHPSCMCVYTDAVVLSHSHAQVSNELPTYTDNRQDTYKSPTKEEVTSPDPDEVWPGQISLQMRVRLQLEDWGGGRANASPRCHKL